MVMKTSKRQDKADLQCSDQYRLNKPEESSCPSQEARLIEHLKQIADEGDFVELSS
jgi:hypothetical protein